MKKLLLFVTFLALLVSESRGSHILGGEVTYKHVTAEKYAITLVVYRDCNECLLDGAGGGSSNKNCNKPSLELKVSSEGTCTGDDIGLIPITRFKIQKILPVCENVKTKCEDNSNFDFGIEAHYYTTIIDFAKYSKYRGCGFELFLRATDRSSEITNLSVGSNAKFYNYSYLNPWVEHNSPQLSESPQLLLACQRTFSHNILASTEADTDSISITSEAPMESRTVTSKFKTNYSKAKPLKVNCNTDCSPDRRKHPINGFYLDDLGNVAFTPTYCGENAIIVYQIEKWRKINGTMVLLSTVRRDIQYIVQPSQNNTPVFADTTEEYSVCIGSDFCLDVRATDAQGFVGGVPQAPDTVEFSWTTNLKNATIKQVSSSQAPYNRLEICWSPKKSDFKQEAYYVRLDIRDNNCPMNASSSKLIKIYTRKNPEISPSVKLLECGHIEVNSRLKKTSFTNEQWLMRGSKGQLVASSSRGTDTLHINSSGNHSLDYLATDKYGCQSSFKKDLVISENFVSPKLIQPILPLKICEGEKVQIELVPTEQHYILHATWFLGKKEIATGLTLKEPAQLEMNADQLTVLVEREVNGVTCQETRVVDIYVKAKPKITLWDSTTVCYGDKNIDLNAEVRPKLGTWFSKQNLIDVYGNFQTAKHPITSAGGEYHFTYTFTDRNSGCRAVKESKVIIAPLPVVDVQDVTICHLEGRFNLKQALLSEEAGATYTWASKDGKCSVLDGHYIDLSAVESGSYHFTCYMESKAGCNNQKSFTLTVLPSAKISFTEIGSICKSDEDLDLNSLLDVSPLGGVWYNNTLNEVIPDGKIPSDYCGEISLNYTYDRQGCYDSKNIDFDVICRPKITITTPDFVCKNIDEFEPTANPVGGVWSGAVMRGSKVVVPQNEDEIALTYTYNHNGCDFDQVKRIVLTEAPIARIPNLPYSMCEGDEILINSPISNVNDWSIDRDGQPWNGTQLSPTPKEIEQGFIDLSVRAIGSGLCVEYTKAYKIAINPSPAIDLTERQRGCEPFDLEFTPLFLNHNIDPARVDINWTFNDPHSGQNSSTDLIAEHRYGFAGYYDLGVRLSTDSGCVFETTAKEFIEVHEKPIASFTSTPDDVLSIHDPVMQFNNQSSCSDEMRYIWDFGTADPSHRSFKKNPAFEFPKDTGSFTITLTAISEHQCISEFTKEIYINPDIRLFVPTAFSPNQKGPPETEVFSVSGVNVKQYQITVWNRWGQIVYQSNDINEVWDGKYSGRYCQSGVFGYKILATSESEQEYIFTGVINLLR